MMQCKHCECPAQGDCGHFPVRMHPQEPPSAGAHSHWLLCLRLAQSPGSTNWVSDFLLLKFPSHILLTMHSGKRDLPYTNSHFPAKPSEFLSPSWDTLRRGEKTSYRRARGSPSHPAAEEGWASRHPEQPSSDKHFIFRKQFWMWCFLMVFLQWWVWAKHSQLIAAGCGSERAFSTPTTRCSQWCSQQRQTGEPGLDIPTTGSTLTFLSVTWKFSL